MKKYLIIRNNGVMAEQAITLMGASTKREQTDKIGMFGTGLKYSLAYWMRNKVPVRIFAGLNEIKLSTQMETLRDEQFERIMVNGKETSFVTSLGKDWKMWQTIREVYSNALDESEAFIDTVNEIIPNANDTRIYIPINRDVEDIIINFDKYFATGRDKDIIYTCPIGDMYEPYADTCTVYRASIRCYDTNLKSVHDYNLRQSQIKVNDERLIKDTWSFHSRLGNMYRTCNKPKIVARMLQVSCNREYVEYLIPWCAVHGTYDEAWLEAISNRTLVPYEYGGKYEGIENPLYLPYDLVMKLSEQFGDRVQLPKDITKTTGDYMMLDTSPLQAAMIKQVEAFLTECDFDHSSFDIKVGRFKSQYTTSHVNHNACEVVICESVFNKGKHELLKELLMANYDGDSDSLYDDLITYLQTKNALPL